MVNQLWTLALVDEQIAAFGKHLAASNQLMTLYLHAAGETVQVNASGFCVQAIESMLIFPEDQKYVVSLINGLGD